MLLNGDKYTESGEQGNDMEPSFRGPNAAVSRIDRALGSVGTLFNTVSFKANLLLAA